MSVNRAFKGQRFRTKEYDKYQRDLLFLLPKMTMPEGKLTIYIQYGFSSKLADLDNPTKQFLDTLQKKYNFNDRDIYKIVSEKQIVPKGEEFIKFSIDTYSPNASTP